MIRFIILTLLAMLVMVWLVAIFILIMAAISKSKGDKSYAESNEALFKKDLEMRFRKGI